MYAVQMNYANKICLNQSHVKYKSDIKQPKCGVCVKKIRNTPHVSDKAYRNCRIRLLSEISVTIRIFAETEKIWIGVLNNCKKDQKFVFSNDQNLYEIKEK